MPWLEHPHRDAYWKHGSVARISGRSKRRCSCVGGWNDAYSNAVPRLMTGLRSPCKAIIGPWAHKYPHFAVPEPRIGFLQEALRWWDFWLKGEPTGVMRDPPFRVYVMDAEKPEGFKSVWPGRWIADQSVDGRQHRRSSNGISMPTALAARPARRRRSPSHRRRRPASTAANTASSGSARNLRAIRRATMQGSLTFDSPELVTAMDIVGAARRRTRTSPSTSRWLSSPCASTMSGRPAKYRASPMALLNLSHRDSHEIPDAARARQALHGEGQARRHRHAHSRRATACASRSRPPTGP